MKLPSLPPFVALVTVELKLTAGTVGSEMVAQATAWSSARYVPAPPRLLSPVSVRITLAGAQYAPAFVVTVIVADDWPAGIVT